MRPSDHSELALFDESPPPAVMEASLTAALGGARRRRVRRATARTVPALALLACVALMVWPKAGEQQITRETPAAPTGVVAVEETRPYTLIRSSDAGVEVVTSQAQGWSAPKASAAVAVVRTADTPPPQPATDTELLAAVGSRPAVLCRFPDGDSKLVVLNAAPPR